MRFSAAVISATLLAAASRPMDAADQRDWDRCKDVGNAAATDQNIAACGRISNDRKETASNRTFAYSNRCALWTTKRDPERALADYNDAIRLDPKYANAFHNRGNVYYAMG